MKTAIYIEDGNFQVVITPETDYEDDLLNGLEKESLKARVFSGQFYACNGGWNRQQDNFCSSTTNKSLIISIREPEPEPVTVTPEPKEEMPF